MKHKTCPICRDELPLTEEFNAVSHAVINNIIKKRKMKNKPGPKPKPESQKARGKTLSFPAPMADFLDNLEAPGPFMRELLAKSPEYRKYLRNLKTTPS